MNHSNQENLFQNVIYEYFLEKIHEGLSTTIPSITKEDIKEKFHILRTHLSKGTY